MFSPEQYRTLMEGAGLLDRDARGRLRLTGHDRRTYLQGLLSNDIVALSAGQGCYATLLTPQGRMISDMRVSELGDSVLMDLPEATVDSVRQRLSDFIFSEDVEVADVRDELTQIGVYGPRAAEVVVATVSAVDASEPQAIASRIGRMALNANTTFALDGSHLVIVRSDDYGVDGFELFLAREKAGQLQQCLRAFGADEVSLASLDVLRIEAGRPEFGIDMDEHTIPLEAGIDDRAISLTKGCYVGQEIIVRVLHRGHGRVAKRLVGLIGDGGASFAKGDRLTGAEPEAKEIGVVTSAAFSPRLQQPIGLGYVHREYAEAGRLIRLAPADGGDTRRVTVADTPFIAPVPR